LDTYLIRPARQKTTQEKAEAEDGFAKRAGVHDFLFDDSGYIFMDFMCINGIFFCFVKAQGFFAIGTFRHNVFGLVYLNRNLRWSVAVL
jgi:hypothetical protein